jgi:DNA-binding response OmpR family regulator
MRSTVAGYTFLLVGQTTETQWSSVLKEALSPLGSLQVVSEEGAVPAVIRTHYDLVIVDAGAVRDAVLLVSRLRVQQPETRIVIATASPTWQRAREALQAGAADYVRKSLDEKGLRSKVQAVLECPSPL